MHLFSESDISEDEVAENKCLRTTTADIDTLRMASRSRSVSDRRREEYADKSQMNSYRASVCQIYFDG